MKVPFKPWFSQLASVPGMIACGVRKPDGKCICPEKAGKYPAEKIEKLIKQFADLHQPLAAPDLSARWVTWVFEYGHLRFVPRSDKWVLMLLVTPETEAMNELDRLSENFLASEFK